MLYFTFILPEGFNRDVDVYFNNRYDLSWFSDPTVVQMVKDVDKSDLLPNGLVISPVLGPIPVTKISGGVKALILMLKTDRVLYGTACGDNCSDWIINISRKKDITLYYEHPMEFYHEFEGVCLDTGRRISCSEEFTKCWLEYKGFNDVWEG